MLWDPNPDLRHEKLNFWVLSIDDVLGVASPRFVFSAIADSNFPFGDLLNVRLLTVQVTRRDCPGV